MKSQCFGLLTLMIFSLTAGALPHASLNQLTQQADPNCNQVNSNNGFGDLIHQVNLVAQEDENGNIPRDASGKIIKKDPRGSLLKLGPKLGMSASEIERARQTTGYVVCPGTKYNNPAKGSGALVGLGGQVVTTAHSFIDENGHFREPLSECFFQNQADPPRRTLLNFSSEAAYKLFSENPSRDSAMDLAVVRLKERVTDTKPFPFDVGGQPLKPGQKIIMISSSQLRMKSGEQVPPTEPVVQGCRMRADKMRSKDPNGRPLSGIFSDCSGTIGASGSIQLVRLNGQLTIKGVHVGGGLEVADFTPFNIDPETPEKSYSYAAEITVKIAEDIAYLEEHSDQTRTARRDIQSPASRGDGRGI